MHYKVLPSCVVSAIHPNNFIEKMVFVLVSELLIYDYNNYSIDVHCECDGNLDVC